MKTWRSAFTKAQLKMLANQFLRKQDQRLTLLVPKKIINLDLNKSKKRTKFMTTENLLLKLNL